MNDRRVARIAGLVVVVIVVAGGLTYLAVKASGIHDPAALTLGLVSIVATIFVALVAVKLAVEQTRVTEALQRLELQEKTTSIAVCTRVLKTEPDAAVALIGDARAALAVFDLARTTDQNDFLRQFHASLCELTPLRTGGMSPSARGELFVAAQRTVSELDDLGSRDLYVGLADEIGRLLRDLPIDLHDLREYLESRRALRVLFGWDELLSQAPTLTTRVFDDRDSLKQLFHPWYWNGQANVDYTDHNGQPIPVGDISMLVSQRPRVSQFESALGGSGEIAWHVVPTYTWGTRRRIVLDGNHRLAAIATSDAQFRILEFEIRGPYSSNVLPDVQRHPKT